MSRQTPKYVYSILNKIEYALMHATLSNFLFHFSKCFSYYLLDFQHCIVPFSTMPAISRVASEGFVGESLSTPLEEGTEDQT